MLGLDYAPTPTDFASQSGLVVQFRTQPTSLPTTYEGRVEQLVSGQVAHFHSLKELLAFMTSVLTEVQQQSNPQ